MTFSVRLAWALLALLGHVAWTTGSLLRKNVASLTDTEILALQSHLRALEDDKTDNGYQKLVAAYHGEPSMCTDAGGRRVACCVHGQATFPQWHRLYTVHFEQALVQHGMAKTGVPYWDWTQPLTELPPIVQDQIFRDPNGGLGKRNAWYSGQIDLGDLHTQTSRAVDDRLFQRVPPGGRTQLFDLVLDALEQEDYCQFEVQFEVAHNHIHYLVGGRHSHSMSTLEYTAFDPLFFLHHSNVDRLFAVWLQLQKLRGKPHQHADCSVELFREKLEPFHRDSNPIQLTRTFSQAKDLFSNLQLGYVYDDLSVNGMSVDQLHSFLQQRRARERAFAVFSLHGLGFSANVRVKVCEGSEDQHDHSHHRCQFAGDFFILGGANEMHWQFHLPFYLDVSEAVQRLGQPLDGVYHISAEVFSVNGTSLGSHVLPAAYGAHRPSAGHKDPTPADGRKHSTVVRKDIAVLTPAEVYALRQAMARFQNDTSIDGFQAVAEFHGLPAKCPHPDAALRYACCVHGKATFPHWHRLFVVEVEDELKSRGLQIGIPYWDWTKPHATIPALAADPTYTDPHSGEEIHNPFYDAAIAFLGKRTSRAVMTDELTKDPPFGDHTDLFDGILLAFEQTDFCDFEVQFEVTHNAPHFLVGGQSNYSLTTLHYSAFDPIFYLHHSNVDRLWAVWQNLQIHRGLPYKAHCASSQTHELLKPFGFPPPWNNDEKTFSHARPTKVYDYEGELDYTYDALRFGGMTVEQLDHYLDERQTRDRSFVGIQLHHIGVSAWVDVTIGAKDGDPYHVGHVAVLGGESEMAWRFDRLFKLEITDALSALGLNHDDAFEVHLDIVDVEGNKLPEDTFSHTTIIYKPGELHEHEGEDGDEGHGADSYIRSDVDSLTSEQVQNLRDALKGLQEDTSSHGFRQIAAFHGQPSWCPSPTAEKKYACCAHGMAIFPHWHRLLTVQAENALHKHGLVDGLPYWDWTLPMTSLPAVVSDETYSHPATGADTDNPLHHAQVDGHKTVRSIRSDQLFEVPAFGKLTRIAEKVMLALEQTDFCDFEIQFEIAHNYIHALVGGNELYSMASLRYTAYDPLFYLHHSNTDRIWAMWQALQRYRGLPYNSATCDIAAMRKPLQPFAQTSLVNPDPVTRDHAVPFDVFRYRSSFHYHYDNFQFNGLSIPQIEREIVQRRSKERVFAGFMLHGIQKSVLVVFFVCPPTGNGEDCSKAGEFYLLGDEAETPWSYDRLFKYEMTDKLAEMGLHADDRYQVTYDVFDLAGKSLGDDLFGVATIVRTGGHKERSDYKRQVQASSHVRRNLEDLSEGEAESLRAALLHMEEDGSFQNIAKFHGYPGLCQLNGQPAACCVHGSPTFPHWHRLYVEQVENKLLSHGSAVSVPYWDWTQPITELPALFSAPTYYNSRTHTQDPNPFFRSQISDTNQFTTRDPRPDLFNSNYFLDNVMLALEQTSFCDFEVQFEITHNAIHSWLGGRGEFSMSGLDYSAFDPVFFLHHANADRIWAIWQALQRERGLSFEESDCALNLMRTPLHPFDNKAHNEFDLTHHYSRPVDVFDYSGHLDYHYDNLKFNGWRVPQLENALKQQRSRDRLFAGFLLHNIGTSADVEIDVCVATGRDGQRSCNHPAGKFSVLGGTFEMPFTFDRLYRFDISDTVRKLGLRLDSAADFDLEVKIKAYNGSYLDSSLINKPTIIFQPGEGKQQDAQGHSQRRLVRKDAWALSAAERRSLVMALRNLQADDSADGFQSLASFHALPPLCPHPEARHRFACCVHGQATFPQWHRLYTVQFEDALRRHGATVGIPYLDSVQSLPRLPFLVSEETWHDPLFNVDMENPWHGASIDFAGATVARDLNQERLAADGPHGYDTWSWIQFMYALEQENYCDFEVQFEIAHNAMHAWIGGSEEFSMGHLHYASYDPIFFLHHSHTDRIFALWQELQKYRGHDANEINCALELMREPLKPFSFGSPWNLNPTTQQYSRPEDAFDYQAHFNYEYDTVELQGLDVGRIQDLINEQKEKDRVFAGFLLHGIGMSAHVEFSVCDDKTDSCTAAGDFNVLGGSAEMPWSFDRLYKYEITEVLHKAGLDVRDPFHIKTVLTAYNGTTIPSSVLPAASVIYDPKSPQSHHGMAPNHVRHSLSDLTERDVMSLKAAMVDMQRDTGKSGYQNIAAFHGAPAMCPDPEAAEHACCVHGAPTFPHWHRLYTVEMEDALIRHGSSVALPYWDWTLPIDELPALFTDDTFFDSWRNEVVPNPFALGYVSSVGGYTVRDPQPGLTKRSKDGDHSVLFDEVLLALEQTDFCDFEVQFEVVHNAIHYLVGGRQQFSFSTLEYSSYDPIFFVHHSFVDKVWAVWQHLQRGRGLDADRADCAVNFMNEKLHPFDWAQFNQDVRTRSHSLASDVFDYEDLGYGYDDLTLGGKTPEELEELIHQQQSQPRAFAGFHLHSIGTSADVEFHVCKADDECFRAGAFFMLGGKIEMDWTFDRLYKYDITDALRQAGIPPEGVFSVQSPVTIKYNIHAVNGSALPASTITTPTIIYQHAKGASADHSDYSVAGVGVRKDINTLTAEETENLRDAMRKVQAGLGSLSYERMGSWHGWPASCKDAADRPVACCHHGMASFPQWHRLYVRIMEMALTFQGAHVGIPYWDWTKSFTELPALVTQEHDNPFHHGDIPGLNRTTSRAPRPQLFIDPEHGKESFFYRQVLLAFEQRDYCDFEVQFEVAHNAIHSWIGGTSPYGMSTLEYSAYDPLFFIHHSNVDRQFAIWQALQKYRGLPYNTANCNLQELRQTLEPFNSPKNPISVIREHARAVDAFNYDQFSYQYDDLNFHGLSVAQLDSLLEDKKNQDRVFVNFMLHNIGTSADVEFDLCDDGDEPRCQFAGTFAVLGGPLEMPWSFDRLFKYDVTSVFKQMRLRPDSEYHFRLRVRAVNGTDLDPHVLESPSVSFLPGRHHDDHHDDHHRHDHRLDDHEDLGGDVTRHEVSSLTLEQVSNLRNALYKLQNDHGPNGFEAISSFHGAPGLCPEKPAGAGEAAGSRVPCCRHGMPVFPHWHRLLTVQLERALRAQGAVVGVPYWDWTVPSKALPSLLAHTHHSNPFAAYHISFADHSTERDLQAELFTHFPEDDVHSLFRQTLNTLEEDNYCDFEVQYEMLHNAVHALVGGTKTHGMATLEFSAFDPLFMVHHASLDRVWKTWQTLQKLRHKPFNFARCAGWSLTKPLEPFSYQSVNADPVTRAFAEPTQVFDTEKFHYHYDNLQLNGHDVPELKKMLGDLRSSPRVFVGLLLHGIGTSAKVAVDIQTADGQTVHAGHFFLLGGEDEMPWAYERPYKLDVTDVVIKAGLVEGDYVHVITDVTRYDGTPLNVTFPASLLIVRRANVQHDVLVVQLGENEARDYKVRVKRGTRVKFLHTTTDHDHAHDSDHAHDDHAHDSNHAHADSEHGVKELGSFTNSQLCVMPPGPANSYALGVEYSLPPGDYFFSEPSHDACLAGHRVMITIDME